MARAERDSAWILVSNWFLKCYVDLFLGFVKVGVCDIIWGPRKTYIYIYIYVGSMKANLTSFKSDGDLQGRQLGSGVFKVKRLSQWVEVGTEGVACVGLWWLVKIWRWTMVMPTLLSQSWGWRTLRLGLQVLPWL